MANTIQIKRGNGTSALLDGELGYNPNLNTFWKLKSPYALFYKGLERFLLFLKMRTFSIFLYLYKFFLNFFLLLFHNQF